MRKIFIGSDHTGHELLNNILEYFKDNKIEYEVVLTDDEKDDYPDIGFEIANKVIQNDAMGIAICGTGIGISIACNKVKGIRASICYDEYTVEMARKHNDLNVLCFGARTSIGHDFDLVKLLLNKYLNTEFEGGRHLERIEKINNK